MDKPLDVLDDPSSSLERLLEALDGLSRGAEPPRFWTKIANDPGYRPAHRRLAVLALFQRHVQPGLTLAELGELLDGPAWLSDDDLSAVTALGGKIPVELTGDSVFVIALFPELLGEGTTHWAIYLRVSGDVSPEDCLTALRGQGGPAAERRLLELSLFTGE